MPSYEFDPATVHTIVSRSVALVREMGAGAMIMVEVPDGVTLERKPFVEKGVLYLMGKPGGDSLRFGGDVTIDFGGPFSPPQVSSNIIQLRVPVGCDPNMSTTF